MPSAKDIADWFGGLAGGATKGIKTRKQRLEEEEAKAMGVSNEERAAETYKAEMDKKKKGK